MKTAGYNKVLRYIGGMLGGMLDGMLGGKLEGIFGACLGVNS